ncbi:unnamed protein product [Caenorhabditis auriculariae]|uniref:Protein quiver n=1 Tax=Caenorhabditis auriculariae TaxID=2777116 RepID=A0A8S1HI10_9PELO|nr:unnamed protein product [Caenorhabditis auriculariae]
MWNWLDARRNTGGRKMLLERTIQHTTIFVVILGEPQMNPLCVAVVLQMIHEVTALLCHQCEGWHGYYPMANTKENACLKLNNACETNLFCVKISEPMTSEATYEPYRSECWFQQTLVIGPGNATKVEPKCYTFFDQVVPPKKWTYCFCNNTDYCNASARNLISIFIILFLSVVL